MATKLVNFAEPDKQWDLATLADIIKKVNKYATERGLENTTLSEIEDQSWSDSKNRRFDIVIEFEVCGIRTRQKLLYLKGQILDGQEFHKRFHEFY